MKIKNRGDVFKLLSFSKEECYGGVLITVKSTLFSDYIDRYIHMLPCDDSYVVAKVIPVAITNYNKYVEKVILNDQIFS